MEAALQSVARLVAITLEGLALLVIAIGAIEALIDVVRVMLVRQASDAAKRAVWLKFARWLVAGLTFQLAADIVQTSITSSWDAIGRVAAVAVIRTFLTFFLDRDIDTVRGLQRESAQGGSDARTA